LVKTIIFQPEHSILPGWEKISTSSRSIQFFLGKFQNSRWRIGIYLAEPGSYLLARLISTLVESIMFLPEDSMLPAGDKITTSGGRMRFLMGHFQLSGRRIEIHQGESASFLLE